MTISPHHFPHPALGIDYGDARIGIAASDAAGIMAHPVETIHRQKTDAITRINELVKARQIRCLVIGLPLHLDGREGDSVPEMPMHFIDEAYTTSTAAAKLHDAGRNAKQQKNIIDQAAAVEILSQWMEQQIP